jgi:hypothetical protein
MSDTPSADAHGHDDHAPAPAAPAPAPAPEPVVPPPNPATRGVELSVLQAAFHISTRSLFVYFTEPGSVLAFTPEDKVLEKAFAQHAKEDGDYADRLAELVRERGQEPTARAFPEKFTRLNFITYTSAASHLREDLATHVAALEQLRVMLPKEATPAVVAALDAFLEERKKHLSFWADEEKKALAAAVAKAAAKKAAAKPAAKH